MIYLFQRFAFVSPVDSWDFHLAILRISNALSVTGEWFS